MNNSKGEAVKNRYLFEEMPIPKALMTLAIPTIVGQLTILIYNMADTFFIGRANNPYMVAGASLILPIFNTCIAIANLAGVGGGSLISRLLGQGRTDEVRKVSSFSFWLSIALAALFAVIMGVFMKPILFALGASGETYHFASSYATWVIVIGGVPTISSMTLANMLRSVGRSKQAGLGVSLGGVLNIGLDPLFMFVILEPGREIIGAAVATFLSNVLVCCYYAIVFYRMRHETVLSFAPTAGLPTGASIRSVFAVGFPATLSTFLFDVDYIVIDRLASNYSDVALAAIGIVLKIERFPLNVGLGLCQGMTPLAGYNFSYGNHERMRHTINFARLVGLGVGIISLIAYEAFAPQLMELFIHEEETVAIGTGFLRVRAIATTFMFLCFHVQHAFQGIGQGKLATVLSITRWAVFNIPALIILDHFFGMYGIVWAQVVGDILAATVTLIIYVQFMKKLKQPDKTVTSAQ